jgi:phage N-6-adenine-methyltransferase
MANDEMYTPAWIFEALDLTFDLDVSAPAGGAPYVPCKKYYTIDDDGLVQDWQGLVWCNPPYSKPSPWVDKWLENANGIALLPLSGNSKWFRKLWASKAKIMMMRPNVDFVKPDGSKQAIWIGTSLWGIGDIAINAMKNSGLGDLR